MRVLLLSPLPELDPPSGDVTYTQLLLADPPPGVEYEDYGAALRAGRIVERGRRSSLRRHDGRPPRLRELGVLVREHLVNRAREHGLLYREPFRLLEVREDYDLVHAHVFSVALSGRPTPLLVSNAAMLEDLYLGPRGWEARRVARANRADRLLARRTGVVHSSLELRGADAIAAATQHLADRYVQQGVDPARVHVLPIPLPPAPPRLPSARPSVVGFVATDFDAKGGRTVLESFRALRQRRAEARLVVIGSAPRLDDDECERLGVTWLQRVPRQELLRDWLPTFDVFAYPTEGDGLPLVVLETLRLGVPVVVSDYQAVPEMVAFGAAGRVVRVGDAAALTKVLDELLEPGRNAEVGRQGLAHFAATYSTDVVRPRLAQLYADVAAAGQRRAGG